MVRKIEALSALTVKNLKAPGYHADGRGLYLQVGKTGTKSWIYRFKLAGRDREMGLGAIADVTLVQAREAATAARQLVRSKVDPIEHRKATNAASAAQALAAKTFDEVAEAFIRANRAGWRSERHAQQVETSLALHASPIIGRLPVSAIETAHVLEVIEPRWATTNETSSRIRGRIESVLDFAKARGYRSGENPARWRGHLDQLLPAPRKVQKTVHHAALDYRDMPGFMAELREMVGPASLALQFVILTACRASEVLLATWNEIDERSSTFNLSADRMKAGVPHRVALSQAALDVLDQARDLGDANGYVFPSPFKHRKATPLSSSAMQSVLLRMKRSDVTVHGMRATFRSWCAEQTEFGRDVAESALAHAVQGVEAAYMRSDFLDRRRKLMEAWAGHCAGLPADSNVVPIGIAA